MKPITVELSKYHLKGLLEGTTTVESMRFPSWKIACAWAGGVTMNTAVSYGTGYEWRERRGCNVLRL